MSTVPANPSEPVSVVVAGDVCLDVLGLSIPPSEVLQVSRTVQLRILAESERGPGCPRSQSPKLVLPHLGPQLRSLQRSHVRGGRLRLSSGGRSWPCPSTGNWPSRWGHDQHVVSVEVSSAQRVGAVAKSLEAREHKLDAELSRVTCESDILK